MKITIEEFTNYVEKFLRKEGYAPDLDDIQERFQIDQGQAQELVIQLKAVNATLAELIEL